MLRFRVWGLSAALTAGIGGPVAADSSPAQPDQGTLVKKIQQLFQPKPPKPGPTVRSGPVTITAPLKPEVVADALQAERDALLRRMSVCTELRRAAIERGDDGLSRQADELERQATSLYYARVSGLGVPRVKASLPEMALRDSADGGLDSDNAATKAKKLIASPSPVPGTATAAVREVNP